MHQILQLVGQVGWQACQWAMKNPRQVAITGVVMKRWYEGLGPREKEQVREILISSAKFLAKLAIGDVVHLAASEARLRGLNPSAVSIVEHGVTRVAKFGLDRTLAEMQC